MTSKNEKTILGITKGRFILMSVTAVLLAVSTLCFLPENPWHNFQVLPLFISLIVMILQSNANRYGYLLGSLNSLIYAAVYLFIFNLYGSALSAALTSFPFQLATFINWSRKPYGNSTIFKKLSKKALLLTVGILIALWLVLYILLSSLGSSHIVLDNTLTVIGLFTTVLVMLSYVDYIYFNLFSQALNLVLYIILTTEDISRLPNLIYMIYATICLLLAWKKISCLYKEQNLLQKETEK